MAKGNVGEIRFNYADDDNDTIPLHELQMVDDGDNVLISKDSLKTFLQQLREENALALEVKIKQLEKGIIESLKRETSRLSSVEKKIPPEVKSVGGRSSAVSIGSVKGAGEKTYETYKRKKRLKKKKKKVGGGSTKAKSSGRGGAESSTGKSPEDEEEEDSEEGAGEEGFEEEGAYEDGMGNTDSRITAESEGEEEGDGMSEDGPRINSAPAELSKSRGGDVGAGNDNYYEEEEEEDLSPSIFGNRVSSLLQKSRDLIRDTLPRKGLKKGKAPVWVEEEEWEEGLADDSEGEEGTHAEHYNTAPEPTSAPEATTKHAGKKKKKKRKVKSKTSASANILTSGTDITIDDNLPSSPKSTVSDGEGKKSPNHAADDEGGNEDSAASHGNKTISTATPLPPLASPPSTHTSKEEKFRKAVVSLGDREWENEIARNIITLYRANLLEADDVGDPPVDSEEGKNEGTVDGRGEYESRAATKRTKKEEKLLEKNKLPALVKGGKSNTVTKASGALQLVKKEGAPKALSQSEKTVTRFIAKLIWFSGSGLARAVWCGLAVKHEGGAIEREFNAPIVEGLDCKHKLCNEMAALERDGKFRKYTALVQGLLQAHIRIFGVTELERRQWRQLVVTCNVFSQKCVDAGKFGLALELLQKAEWLGQDEIIDQMSDRMELKAFVEDAYSYYYYRRGKYRASMQYVKRASITHSQLGQWEHVAKCYLHRGSILAKLNQHDESIRIMGQVLTLVERDRLEVGGATAQKICLVAVCYHNIAAEQLVLMKPHEACISSQNARRLARLSLSYSNRWLKQFESTHAGALAALSGEKDVAANFSTQEQAKLFSSLTSGLYS